ncbi:hypothetical protein C2G38_2094899, partial [Gigaspora rosea]
MIFQQKLWILMHPFLQLPYLLVKKFTFNFLSVKFNLLIHLQLLMMNILQRFHHGLIVVR